MRKKCSKIWDGHALVLKKQLLYVLLNQHITKVTIFFSLIYYNLKVSIFNRTNILFLFNMNRLEACLKTIASFGNIRGRKLLEFCKTPEAVFDANPKDFLT